MADDLARDLPSDHDESPGTRGAGRAAALLLAALLLGFGGGVGGYLVASRLDDGSAGHKAEPSTSSSAGSDAAAEDATPVRSGSTLSPHQIYVQAGPGVVHVNASIEVRSTSIFGFPQSEEGEASGSGFVIDRDGYIVTNAHVVEGATKVNVRFSDDTDIPAKLVGMDLSTDVAVLQVDVKGEKLRNALRPIPWGSSARVQVGDPVVAIGNPFDLDRTLTSGVVSALQRKLTAPNGFSIDNVIQTDAAINPGNSGGPLLNMRGEVIGINSQIETGGSGRGNVGIGFAVPSSTVQRVAGQLIKDGVVKHAYLGVVGTTVDKAVTSVFRLPTTHGVLVAKVADGSPADRAGIKGGDRQIVIDGENLVLGGDVIVEVGGTKITSMRQLVDVVGNHDAGDVVKVVWYHGSDRQERRVKLATRPDSASRISAQ